MPSDNTIVNTEFTLNKKTSTMSLRASVSSPIPSLTSIYSEPKMSPVPSIALMAGSPRPFPSPKSRASSPLSVASSGFVPSIVPTSDERNTAKRLMQQQRQRQHKTHAKPYSFKESNPVLVDIVSKRIGPSDGATAGVVKVLLGEFGASLSIARPKSSSFGKKIIGVDQDDVPHSTDLLAEAIQNCNADVVLVLLQYADAASKTRALPVAMQSDDPLKVEFVMASGANATPLCEEFQKVVRSGSFEMLYVLVATSKTRGPCQRCLDVALLEAVRGQDSVRRTQALLDNGADTNFQGAAALFTAIQDGRADLVGAITSVTNPNQKVCAEELDKAVLFAYERANQKSRFEAQCRIVASCLAAGAKGDYTNQTLLLAVQNRHSSLVDGFVKHQVSVYDNQDAGTAVVEAAIRTEEPKVVSAVLRIGGGPSSDQMKNGLILALSLENRQAGNDIASLLLESGLRGDFIVSKGLLSAIKTLIKRASQPSRNSEAYKADYRFVNLFLHKGAADVDYQGGEALLLAAGQGLTSVLCLLIQHHPSTESLSKAVLPAMRVLDPRTRFDTVKMLLQAGAQGPSVGEALTQSAGMGKDQTGLTAMLLQHSSVDFEGGRPLVSAVRSGCLDQIELLFDNGPSSSTVAAAWVEISTVNDEKFQIEVYEMLLRSGKADKNLCDRALVGAAALGHRGSALCELMLQNGASPTSLNGQAVATAAKHFHLDTLELFSEYIDSEAVYTTAFEALTETSRWLIMMSDGLPVVQFLLGKGASGKVVDAAFCQAARIHEMDAIELLLGHVSSEVFGVALMSATSDSSRWLSPDDTGLELINLLLETGAKTEFVNPVLLEAAMSNQASEAMIKTLMTVGEGHADVNFQEGEALKRAIRNGNVQILDWILYYASQTGCSASLESMTQAFAEAITTHHLEDDKVILKILDVLTKQRDGTSLPDFTNLLPQYNNWAPIFACIEEHPRSPELVQRLAKLGCDIKAETYLNLYLDDEEVQAEPANALLWAVCSTEEHQIASQTIEALIDVGVDVNFTSAVSRATPLVLAAKYGRGDIIGKLLARKAKVGARDFFDRSALFYASRIGDTDAIKALTKAKSRVNDGSLHEAARNLHSEAVELLIKAEHNVNYPSSDKDHDGRDPLQELALMARPSESQASELQDTIRALTSGKDTPKVLLDPGLNGQKNAMFLALDNEGEGCWLVCRALLDEVMWKHINDAANVYCEPDPDSGTRLFRSPTMYVDQGLFYGPEKFKDGLLRLLYGKRCQDRFYAEIGAEQPPGATGLPDDIAKDAAKRKARELKMIQEDEDHQRMLLRKELEEQDRRETELLRHEEKLLHQREVEEQKRQQAEFSHIQKMDHAAGSHEQKLHMQQQMERSRQHFEIERANFEETKKQRMNALAENKLQREQQLKITFDQRMSAQRLERQKREQKQKIAFEQRMSTEKLARQRKQNLLAQEADKSKIRAQKNTQALKANGEKKKLEFKKKQNGEAKNMLKAQLSNKREVHGMQMEKVHEDQETLRMKAAMKYFDGNAKHMKRIGV